jgi:hypothetical protein
MQNDMDTDTVTLVANGDLRPAANRDCWPAQVQLEQALTQAVEVEGYRLERGHAYDSNKGHGFIDSQRRGIEVFRQIAPTQPLIVAFAAWQYSQHLLPGLLSHEAPLLMVANWSGEWPGLVGMLNMNGCLTKAGVEYSTLWGEEFTEKSFRQALRQWLDEGRVEHDTSHVHPATGLTLPDDAAEIGRRLACTLKREKAIMGVFDEGCMGMFNAILPDHLLNPTGVFKERLSQSALYYETTHVSDEEAQRCRDWLDRHGMTFYTGDDPAEELTDEQILDQLKMYIAALRLADDFGCDCIGIQYQQGLKDLLPASDLAEGLINNGKRPPVYARNGRRELFAGRALPHFNEADEGAGLDAVVTNRVWRALGYPPETTLHDLRWGRPFEDDYVWVFEISGAVPPAHLGGYEQAKSHRQPPMYFPSGGSTIKGRSRPGEIVWSRIYVENDTLKADLGRGRAVELPEEEAERRSEATTPQWPIMHAVTYGGDRDQMMARHKSNHVQVAYAPDAEAANRALATKAAMFQDMGIESYVCGDRNGLV